ncbi:Glucose dehydrogenase [Planctomycetales bacterium 10988]|nr:Glucose dehydrogenase [Planctomycetales bacterium 10988]
MRIPRDARPEETVLQLESLESRDLLAGDVDPDVTTERIAAGLNQPLYLTYAPGDTSRLFVVEKGGDIEILNAETGSQNVQPFLTVNNVSTVGEQGLLGLAFDPNYQSNGYFYVNYVNASGSTVISRYQVSGDPNAANAGSEFQLLSFVQPETNHNGGWLGFGPDNYLYIASGDGGGGGDPDNNAQNTSNLFGNILRIDVTSDAFPADNSRNYAIPPTNPFVGQAGADEIFVFGLRNPWRASFDRTTGDLYIGDVGQGAREEIDFVPAGSAGGLNFGWKVMEGATAFSDIPGNPDPFSPELVNPIYEYAHPNTGGRSITGGYVYRGEIVSLQGKYFFADFVAGTIESLEFDGTTISNLTDWTTQLQPAEGSINSIVSFGEDAFANLYIVDIDGEVYKIISTSERAQARGVVSQYYLEILGREAEDGALDYWAEIMVTQGRAVVANSFWNSAEHRATQVQEYYQMLLNRAAEQAGVNYWVNQMQQGLTEENLILALVNSQEYRTLNPLNADYVRGLYNDLLGREVEEAGLNYWVSELESGRSPDAIGQALLFSQESREKVVTEFYQSILKRNPDPGGLASWANQLAVGNTYTFLAVALYSSDEYFFLYAGSM